MITNIPTKYNGVQFRSRLEAKWATLFDILGWKWHYEPIDFNGWIPDFMIEGSNKSIFVEIKPFFSLKEFQSEVIPELIPFIKEGKTILLLGAKIYESDYHAEAGCIGWELTFDENIKEIYIDEIVLNYYDKKVGYIGGSGGWGDRITGLYDGDTYVFPIKFSELEKAWKLAGNHTQWRKS